MFHSLFFAHVREYLGEHDVRRYSIDWAERRKDYEVNGLSDSLITTDDLEGVKEERIHDNYT